MRMIHGLLATATLLAFLGDAHAQLFKCVAPDGKVSYQSDPCVADSKASTITPPPPAPGSSSFGTMKSGWSEQAVVSMKTGCTQSATRDFKAGWQKSRKEDYPDQEFRPSIESFCDCLARRTSASVTSAEFAARGSQILGGYMKEALAGGACAPGGRLGREIKVDK